MSDSDNEGGVPLIEPQFSGAKKRKRNNDSEARKEKKRRRNKKPNDIHEDDLDEELGVNLAIGRMDGDLMVNYVARRTKKFEPDLSPVELDELYLPAKSVRDTSSWDKPRTLDNLPSFVREFADKDENLELAKQDPGCPHTIVVAAAGIRAADLTRALRVFQSKKESGGKVTKLFAKHIKLKEAIEECRKTRISLGVGTPQRIHDLLEDGALSAKHLKRIIIDASYIDQKKRGILDMKETEIPLVKLLTRKDLRERYEDATSPVKLLFY
ncbi:uncharacterized protein PV09_04747 [Verruconis gallopava]|uniref:Protein CMS1 n=1 Tax=Verruconis gallopava TaxID=253628 RepID=A0A0D2AXJ6_9PEZI|nr:uncharacterized protein PV09_04747 [Verruconis gallopava]KIW03904.1 hypothetical protein PV09_04747 [Verruconis gallopava]